MAISHNVFSPYFWNNIYVIKKVNLEHQGKKTQEIDMIETEEKTKSKLPS